MRKIAFVFVMVLMFTFSLAVACSGASMDGKWKWDLGGGNGRWLIFKGSEVRIYYIDKNGGIGNLIDRAAKW